MWSLPNIKQMNSEAASQQKKFEKMLRSGKDGRKNIKCDHDNDECSGEIRLTPWYDIFSDDIKGINAACEYHDDRNGRNAGGLLLLRWLQSGVRGELHLGVVLRDPRRQSTLLALLRL